MKTRALKLLPSALLLIVPLLLALVSQSSRIQPAAAQTGGATATPAGPSVSVCGTIVSFTPATPTTAGSIVFGPTGLNKNYAIAAGTTLVGQAALTAGANVCLAGQLNAAGALVSGVITSNILTAVVICGPVTAYTAATSTALGSLTIGGIVFTTAMGSSFTGTALAAGANVCLTAMLNGLGSLVSGTAAANPGGISLTGPFTTFIPPTATAAGLVTFGVTTFTIPAGTTIKVGGAVPLSATPAGGGGVRMGSMFAL